MALLERVLDALLEVAHGIERNVLGVEVEFYAVRLPLEVEVFGGQVVEAQNGLELAENIGLKRLVGGGEAGLKLGVGHDGRRGDATGTCIIELQIVCGLAWEYRCVFLVSDGDGDGGWTDGGVCKTRSVDASHFLPALSAV